MTAAELDRHRYMSLATFRRTGAQVATPVWFAAVAGRLYVVSAGDSGKVKRLRNAARARVAPCDARGGVRGPWQDATARVITDAALIERARLDATLDRLAGRRDTAGEGDLRVTLQRLAEQLRGSGFLDHVASKTRDRVQLIAVDQVTHLVARQRATYAVTPTGEHMLDMTLLELERRLDPSRFFRIHRAMLVNLAYIAELRADEDGHLMIRLKDATHTELPVSRDRVRALKERLGVV